MTDYLLSSILREKNTELLMKVKDKFLDAEGVKWFGFVRHSLANTRSMPTKQAIELKFNISLNETQDKAEHWWAEVQKSYKKRVVEDAVKAASRDQANGFTIFQNAITEANSEDGARVFQYGDGSLSRYDTYQNLKKNGGISYLPVGMSKIDEVSYGYTKADLWTIGGGEGVGKSWLLLKFALLVDDYMKGKNLDRPILIVNTEVDTDELLGRMDCLRFKLDYGLFMQGQLEKRDEMRYKRGLQTLKSNIKVVDDCFDLNDVANYIVLYNPGIVFIDGSHLLAKEYEWKEIANLTAGMKKMTRRYQIPIVNFTHLKAGKGKEKEGGSVDDFAYGKGYTRNSDVAIMLFKTDLMEIEGELGVDFVKVRRGKRRKMIYKTDFKTMEYTYLREASSDTEVEEETPTVGW